MGESEELKPELLMKKSGKLTTRAAAEERSPKIHKSDLLLKREVRRSQNLCCCQRSSEKLKIRAAAEERSPEELEQVLLLKEGQRKLKPELLLRQGVQRKSKPELLLRQRFRGTQTRTVAEERSERISNSEQLLRKEVQRNS